MIESLLDTLAASPVAAALKASQLAYPIVNAVHILGLATLFGSILALDVVLIARPAGIDGSGLARLLPRVATCGLATAVLSGLALFSVQPHDYAGNPAFRLKLVLVGLGILHAALARRTAGWQRLVRADADRPEPRLRVTGAVSLAIWTAAVVAGRFIAFV
ncbi:DUF2214 domain-containing protein [Mangrovibrevibacter kandeliae]|uniref:DUF2214 domain-containing protein n=1 Tax=Mangrovibrevibacter kandeliae TaxID=2968473 RepID=UPI00211903D0|nr:DUF2214 domain-containing protein [Aurantimonas sp. CSK15Z-1]MCQ8782408.1 DUF2214 domain-containing protein [Aurantimonas sp. CSK15Z-1]